MQTEDIQKLQLIPLQKPLIASNNLHGKRLLAQNEPVAVHQPKPKQLNAGANTSVITIENAPHPFDGEQHSTCNDADNNPMSLDEIDSDDQPILFPNTSSSPINQSIKQNKRLEKKRLKQQQKQLKKINKKLAEEKKRNDSINARAKKAAKKSEKSKKNKSDKPNKKQFVSNDGDEPQVPGSSKQKPNVNVKFAVDTVDNSANCLESRISVNGPSGQHGNEPSNQNTNGFGIQNGTTPNNHTSIGLRYAAARRNSGEYDALPMIKVETQCNNEIYDGNGNVIRSNPITIPFARSSFENIPYIEDSPNVRRAASVPIDTRNRFITLQQRGIGAQGIIYARKIEKFNFPINITPKREQFDKSAQILYQSLKESIDHHFERAAYLNSKLCQVCHEFLVIPEAVKCLTCGLVCHHSCTIAQVSGNLCFMLVLLLEKNN